VRLPEIVPFEPAMTDDCAAILNALPDWFGFPDTNEGYISDLSRLPSFVALDGGAVLGFSSLLEHNPESAEIQVLAVRPDNHRRGIGRMLVRHGEEWLRQRGVRVLHVKTLGPSREDEGYERTRRFYRAVGFTPLFETTALWGEDNPALILVKWL
jgi:ribosomal protein S18 acetylase RimI-like enzyme